MALNDMRNNVQVTITTLLIIFLMVFTQACTTTRSVSEADNREALAEQAQRAQAAEGEYRFRPGDEIEILVWEQPSFNTLTTVSRLGTISMPLLGEIVVTGLTQEELKRELERQLSEFIRGEIIITISVRNMDNLIVSVFGMVENPDNYPVVDQTSIFRILSTAGGFTENANLKKVKVYRQTGPENYVTLNLLDYLESGQMDSPTILVRPGDIVYVPRKNNAVRESSEFLRDVIILFGIFRVFN